MYLCNNEGFSYFLKDEDVFNPDFSVDRRGYRERPEMGRSIMVVKNENSNPPEKNLRVTHKEDRKGFPDQRYRHLLQENIGRKVQLLFLWVIRFMSILINTVTIVMELFVLWTMVKHGKVCPIRSCFRRGFSHGTAFAVDATIVESLIADRNYNPLIPDNLADPSVSNLVIPIIFYGTTDLDYGLGRAELICRMEIEDFVNWSFEGFYISGFDWSKGYDYTNDKGEKKRAISGIGRLKSD